MSQTRVERESCPLAGGGVKRSGAAWNRAYRGGIGVYENMHYVHDSCDTDRHYLIG